MLGEELLNGKGNLVNMGHLKSGSYLLKANNKYFTIVLNN